MNAQVRYSATVIQSMTCQVMVSTYDDVDGYGVTWSGTVQAVSTSADGRVLTYEGLANVYPSSRRYWDTHEDAIADAVASFDGTDTMEQHEDVPCLCCGGSFLRGASMEFCDACFRGECKH